ncbi:MAG: hypothetical protein UHZ06_03390 [Paludibacteraceae bacterium]|nr:hypothetical protein [Paludibacteraceae bacterium]
MDKFRIASIVAKVFVILVVAAVLQFVKEEYYMRMLLIVWLPYLLMYSLWFSVTSISVQKTPLWLRVLVSVLFALLAFGFAYYQNWLKI